MKISLHRNYIISDKFLDYMNIYGKSLGYSRDDSYKTFDKDLLLDSYIKKNKMAFIENIKRDIGKEFIGYETSIGKIDLIIPTKNLQKYFHNGKDFVGDNLSMMTIEYCNLKTNKDNIISNTPHMQKYYKYKNWMLKRECIRNHIKIDHSFIIGRRYNDYPAYSYLYENTETYEDLYQEITQHHNKLHSGYYRLGKNIFPNMKNNNDFPWHNAKKKIAARIKEITLLRGLSVKTRDTYVSNGINSYKMIETNMVKNDIPIVANGVTIQRRENSLFIDFEILTNIYDDFSSFPDSNTKEYIFNIGCGFIKRRAFSFKSYIAHNLSEEEKIINDFIDFINDLPGNSCTLYHWTNIEKRLLMKKIEEHNIKINKQIEWFDLHKFFVDNEILIKDCYTYKLKHVARALNKYCLIKSKWNNTFSDGLGAMTGYIKYLNNKDKKLIKDIAHYNMIDCKVLWEIHNLFIS